MKSSWGIRGTCIVCGASKKEHKKLIKYGKVKAHKFYDGQSAGKK